MTVLLAYEKFNLQLKRRIGAFAVHSRTRPSVIVRSVGDLNETDVETSYRRAPVEERHHKFRARVKPREPEDFRRPCPGQRRARRWSQLPGRSVREGWGRLITGVSLPLPLFLSRSLALGWAALLKLISAK